jgi:VanZ family protein
MLSILRLVVGKRGFITGRAEAASIIGGFLAYAGILEYLQHFSPGRHPSIAAFAASALGALCGGLASALLWHRRVPV